MYKKRIGVCTVGRQLLLSNYGSFFQHLALRRVLNTLGFECFRVEYEHIWSELWALLLPLRSCYGLFRWLLHGGKGCRPQLFSLNESWQRVKFALAYRRVIAHIFERQKFADAYIAGGDCVWFNTDKRLFLLETPASARRISYAVSSSWEWMSKEQDWVRCIKEVGNTFYALSARERIGCEIIGRLTNRHVAQTLDPVLLIDREVYCGLALRKKMFSRPTLLYYVVNIDDPDQLFINEVLGCATELGCDLKVVAIQGAERYVSRKHLIKPSPDGFLAAYRDAKYVITNSFHGIVFAVKFGKQFAFIPQRSCKWGNQNLRQTQFLSLFGLCAHQIPSDFGSRHLIAALGLSYTKESLRLIENATVESLGWLQKHVCDTAKQESVL